jgi:transcription elongation factor Elf1
METLENIVRGSYNSHDERSTAIEIIKERTDYCTHSSVIFATPVTASEVNRRAICKFCGLAFSRYLRVGNAITYVPFYSKEVVSYDELTLEGVKPLDLGQKS